MTDPRGRPALSGAPYRPWHAFWREFRRSPPAIAGAVALGALYLLAAFAPFVAPYGQASADRQRFFHPPHRVHWLDARGRPAWPHVRGTRLVDPRRFVYREDPLQPLPIRWLVRGEPYRLFGVLPADRHLFGVDAPHRVFLLGADSQGRDVWSRVVFGTQVSLTVGLVGIAISFALGLLLGGISGYVGGATDTVIMRFTELLLSIPGLYLIVALRAVLPAQLSSRQAYLAIVAILALIGWASLARVIRGMVLSIRGQDYVAAAEALGAGRWRIVARHILPNTLGFVVVAATVSIPGYILGEVFLSFLGLGVQEPDASWGNMLNAARSLRVLTSFPWMVLAPGAAIVLTVMAYNVVGDGLRDALDPRRAGGGRTA
jgi:peptide/nickel transport system permease protein